METKNEEQIYNKKQNNNQLSSLIIKKKRIRNEIANSSSARYKQNNDGLKINDGTEKENFNVQEMMDESICFFKNILFKKIYSKIKIGLFNIKNYFKEKKISNFKIKLNHGVNKKYNLIIYNGKNKTIVKMIKYILLINIFLQTISNIFYFCYSQDSKISLQIKGIGNKAILGNKTTNYFNNMKYLKEVWINGDKQNEISKRYDFHQSENYVDLIWDENIEDCTNMFYDCSDITEINLSQFKIPLVKSLRDMFSYCSSLVLIDLSNFDTSSINSMEGTFSWCYALTSLDLSSFNTSSVNIMRGMFYQCSSLTSLNVSNFDTSHVDDMFYMFALCPLLTSLDLSNFNTSLVNDMQGMFYGSTSLEYINLNNFHENKLGNYQNMFSNIQFNPVICTKEIDTNKIYNSIKNNNCYVIDCSNDWKSKQKKLNNNNQCVESCDNDPIYKYEYNGKCIQTCTDGLLTVDNSMNKCKCELRQCLQCPIVALSKGLCSQCNTGYYPKENDPENLDEYIKCYNNIDGYYLDKNLFKKCYYTCKKCNIKGDYLNHNCIECNYDYPFSYNKNPYFNCYENCDYYFYFDNEYNFHCTRDSSCPNNYPKLIQDTSECMEYDFEDIKNMLLNEGNQIEQASNEEQIAYYDNILKLMETGFIAKNYNTSNIDLGNDEIIKADKFIVTLTTT